MNRSLIVSACLLSACGASTLDIDESPYLDHDPGVLTAGLNVGQAGGCSTNIVSGLSSQLVEELNCIQSNLMQPLSGSWVRFNGTATWSLQASAENALKNAANAANDYVTLNSAYRTVAEQAVLYRWWQNGQCGIQAAAAPGASNHQSGRAIDLSAYTYWRPRLTPYGWTWLGSGDVVHFDFLSAPSIASKSVLAFQRLWNKNNGNKLAEDGAYGPASTAAMNASPATGFPNHGCAPPPPPTGTLKGLVYKGTDTTAIIIGATVLVGGKTLTTDSTGLYTVTLPVGMYSITASAPDYETGSVMRAVAGGQTVWGSIGLTAIGKPDTTPPDLALISPDADAKVDVSAITLNGTASDAMGTIASLTLTQNGGTAQPVMLAGGMFQHQVTLAPGVNVLALEAKDAAGNVATLPLSIIFRAGLEGEVATPDIAAKPIEGVALELRDGTGAVIASTQTGVDGHYGFDLDVVPVHVTLSADAYGYESFKQELDVGADARVIYGFVLQPLPPDPMNRMMNGPKSGPITGGCSAAPSLLMVGALALLRRRRSRAS